MILTMREHGTTGTGTAAAGSTLTGQSRATTFTGPTAAQVAVPISETATADSTGAETFRLDALGPVLLLTALTIS